MTSVPTPAMTPAEFYDAVERHDFWYAMSDDHRVYMRGAQEADRLIGISHSDPALRQIWLDWVKYYNDLAQGFKPDKPTRPGATDG